MSKGYSKLILECAIIFLVATTLLTSTSIGATPSDYSNTSNAINSAFAAISSANQNGGNVSSLVAKLNEAVALYQKAQSENSTNPTQATTDLESANQLATQVSTQAPVVGSSLAAERQATISESVIGLLLIVIFGILVYTFGGRIYRIMWLRVYRNHLVRRVNG